MRREAPRAHLFRKPKASALLTLALLLAIDASAASFQRTGAKSHKAKTPPPQAQIKLNFPTIPTLDPSKKAARDGKTGTTGTNADTEASDTSTPANGTLGTGTGSASNAYNTAISQIAAGKTGSASASLNGAKSGAGSSSTGGVSDSAKVGFDESRKSTDAVSTVDSGAGGDSKGPGPGAKGEDSEIKTLPLIWPMCIFAAQGTGNSNRITDQLIKMAAKCDVQLMVFPMFVKSTRGDGNAVATAASEKCNADVGLKRFGVNRATALVITDDEKQPAQYCGVSGMPPKDKRGCAQSTFKVGYGVTTRLANTEGLPPKASNKIAAAIVHKSATIQDFAYWTQGWGQVGRPPGPGGNRVGDASMGYSDARSEKVGWDDTFCDDMKKNSFKNPGIKYNPKHDKWMMEPDDKGKLVDLFDKKPLWKQPNAPPSPGKELKDPSSAGGGGDLASSGGPEAGGGSGGGSGSGFSRMNGGGFPASGGEAVLGAVTAGGGHKIAGKRPNGRGDTVRTVGSAYGGGGSAGGGTVDLAAVQTGGGADASVVGVDRGNSNGTNGGMKGGKESVGFDESMTANGGISSVGTAGGGGSGGSVLGGSDLSGGTTALTGAGGVGGVGGTGGNNGGVGGGTLSSEGPGLSPMDASFFSKLNFVPIEGIRKRIPLLKDSNGAMTARERGNWDYGTSRKNESSAASTAVAAAPSRGPASVGNGEVRNAAAARTAETPSEASIVINRRSKTE